jgi:hypothetical protein
VPALGLGPPRRGRIATPARRKAFSTESALTSNSVSGRPRIPTCSACRGHSSMSTWRATTDISCSTGSGRATGPAPASGRGRRGQRTPGAAATTAVGQQAANRIRHGVERRAHGRGGQEPIPGHFVGQLDLQHGTQASPCHSQSDRPSVCAARLPNPALKGQGSSKAGVGYPRRDRWAIRDIRRMARPPRPGHRSEANPARNMTA